MDDFIAFEEHDAVRLSWNVWPNSRLEATKCVIPLGAFYTPLKRLPNLQEVPYDPVPCKSCGAILNPYASLDFAGRLWICCFCHSRNHFPAHYQGMTEHHRVAETYPEYSTIEYIVQRGPQLQTAAYLFVIDITVAEDELRACCAAVSQALQLIPEDARVGLITFGTHVQVYELGFTDCVKSYVFKGTKEYTNQQIVEQLGLMAVAAAAKSNPAANKFHPVTGAGSRFILPLADCEVTVSGILDELQRDAFPAVSDNRPARCTGTALQVAASLMGGCLPAGTCMGRLMLFVGGPTTEGLGRVVEKELHEPIRSHKDLAKDAAPLFKRAKKYYDGLGNQLVGQGHTLDVFAVALEQVGLAEMKAAVAMTGGLSVQTDTYNNPVFKDSLKRVFAPPDDLGFVGLASNATFEVIPSRDIKVAGVLGPAAPLEKKSPAVSEHLMGVGATTLFKLASLDSGTTLLTFFDVVAGGGKDKAESTSQQFFLQFITKYLHPAGQMRCRVTTITRGWVDGSSLQDLVLGFDQEASAVMMARLAGHKMETEDEFDATRWLDRTLIRLSQRFGEYNKDDPTSFMLSPQMSLYPQFMFNLRRSHFVQVFGHSPDETAYARLLLDKQPVADGVMMIQPQIFAHSFESEGPEPVMLDVTSIVPDRILFLDAFFYVVVFFGTTVAQWRAAGYQDMPEHAAFSMLLKRPMEEAAAIARRRFPVPKIVECDQNTSQARFLLARLNPSATYNNNNPLSSEVIMTDDVSLSVFFEHLKKLAVQS